MPSNSNRCHHVIAITHLVQTTTSIVSIVVACLFAMPPTSTTTTTLIRMVAEQQQQQQQQQQTIPCLVEMCTNRHTELLEEHGTLPSSNNPEYCLLLKDYLSCLNDSFATCLSQLEFHSAITAANQRWRKFKCKEFEGETLDKLKCQFWSANADGGEEDEEEEEVQQQYKDDYDYGHEFGDGGNADAEQQQQNGAGWSDDDDKADAIVIPTKGPDNCAVFGQLHLRSLYYSMPEQCSTVDGAHALFDSKFFLVQITATNELTPTQEAAVNNHTHPLPITIHVVSKMALIVRPRRNCVPGQKMYLADAADPGPLPATFEDGTNGIEGEGALPRPVEIVVSEEGNRVDIRLAHLASTVRVRKFGQKFLNIYVEVPKRLLHLHYKTKDLCTDGCRAAAIVGAHSSKYLATESEMPKHQQHQRVLSCEEWAKVVEECAQLLTGRIEPSTAAAHRRLNTKWHEMCVASNFVATASSSSSSPVWYESFRATLDDLFGEMPPQQNWTLNNNTNAAPAAVLSSSLALAKCKQHKTAENDGNGDGSAPSPPSFPLNLPFDSLLPDPELQPNPNMAALPAAPISRRPAAAMPSSSSSTTSTSSNSASSSTITRTMPHQQHFQLIPLFLLLPFVIPSWCH